MALITTEIVIKKKMESGMTGYDWRYHVYKRYRFLNWFKFDRFIDSGADELTAINFVERMKGPKIAWEKIID